MHSHILKYESVQKFIHGVREDVLKYKGKDKLCIIGLGENGVFYGEGLYQWLQGQGHDVNFTTIDDDGRGLEVRKIKGRKILMVDSHIITGKCYQQALNIVRSKQKAFGVKDIKCAVMHDLRGLADFVVERYLSPKVKLDHIDLEIIKILSKEGKQSFSKIAERVGLTSAGIKRRVDRLLEQRILGIKGVINLEKFYSVSANIGIGTNSFTRSRIIEKLKRNPLVYNLMKVSGSNKSLIIDVVAPNLQIIEDFLDREIRSEAGIDFIEVNTGGLPVIPKEITMEEFKPLASEINLKRKYAQ